MLDLHFEKEGSPYGEHYLEDNCQPENFWFETLKQALPDLPDDITEIRNGIPKWGFSAFRIPVLARRAQSIVKEFIKEGGFEVEPAPTLVFTNGNFDFDNYPVDSFFRLRHTYHTFKLSRIRATVSSLIQNKGTPISYGTFNEYADIEDYSANSLAVVRNSPDQKGKMLMCFFGEADDSSYDALDYQVYGEPIDIDLWEHNVAQFNFLGATVRLDNFWNIDRVELLRNGPSANPRS